jgi:hypothetical protein
MAHNDHKGNGHGHVSEIPDVSYIKNVDVTHETSDVNVFALLKFVLALTIMTAAVYVLMLFLFKFLNTQETQNEPPAGPMAMSEQESLPPEPRLQSAPGFAQDLSKSAGDSTPDLPKDPLWEIRVLRQQWDRDLREGPKDSSGRSVGIPIEAAMQKLVTEQGAKTGESKMTRLEGYGEQMPTAASSGRVTVKQ